ncbi:hypothetical protein CS542_06820 [Pedobacter sp. IW39]|nr:hypothetical protein CS542_06820 [Pedobacter sp. IW39]
MPPCLPFPAKGFLDRCLMTVNLDETFSNRLTAEIQITFTGSVPDEFGQETRKFNAGMDRWI